MKLLNVLVILAKLFLPFSAIAQTPRHVVLVTIDGLRPEFYLDPKWEAKHLRSLMKNGAAAKGVNSVFPSLTYPNHTSIITGTPPAEHGVYYNAPFIATTKQDSVYWQFGSIRTMTLWEAARNSGLSTASVLWPVSADAPIDYNIPDVGKLGDRTYKHSTPAGLIEEIKKTVYQESGTDMKFLFYSPIQNSIDENIAVTAAYIIKTRKPGFISIHLLGLDHYQHLNGREGDKVKDAVKATDSAIGIIVDALSTSGVKEQTTIIVVGDHGFVDSSVDLHPNVWLREANLIGKSNHDDWKAFFVPVAGSSFLHLKEKNDSLTLKRIIDIINNRSAEEKKHFRIISYDKLIVTETDPRASLALTGENGAVFGWDIEGKALKPKVKARGDHGHFPDFKEIQTGFIAQGSGIKKGKLVDEMSVKDIAPLVSQLLNLGMTNQLPVYLDHILEK